MKINLSINIFSTNINKILKKNLYFIIENYQKLFDDRIREKISNFINKNY